MEKRNIAIDIKTAKEWFNSDDKTLKELALQAYTEQELKTLSWQEITTFKKACEVVGKDYDAAIYQINEIQNYIGGRMLVAQYKLAIIKKALNGDWDPNLNDGKNYYPYFRWYPKVAYYPNGWTALGNFKDLHNNKTYTLIGGGDCGGYDGGLGYFGCGFGVVRADAGLLSCKSKEIALHLGKYFGKIIFDAVFGQYNNYQFINEQKS